MLLCHLFKKKKTTKKMDFDKDKEKSCCSLNEKSSSIANHDTGRR